MTECCYLHLVFSRTYLNQNRIDRFNENMNPVSNVELDVNRVISNFESLQTYCDKCLNGLIEEVKNVEKELSQCSDDQLSSSDVPFMLNNLIRKIRDRTSRLAKEHRDFHSSVSRIGKAIDKNFVGDYACMENRALWQDTTSKQLLNKVIVEHFLRKGMLEIVDELVKEAHIGVSEEEKKPFADINYILEALKHRDLEPALKWAEDNREKLAEQKSSLEFKLHRLQFIEYLSQGVKKQSELINYARTKLQPLAFHHEKEIQTLMGSLIYLKTGIENSPYAYLLDILNWNEICDTFMRDACCLMGMSVDSPLNIAFEAGCIAFPALLNIRQVMQQRRVSNVWTAKDELPIVINLGQKLQFHSIFACPILRQQSTENNPPMRLVCGHVISRDALNKMANGGPKVKCPYCPVEQNPQSARQIFF